MKTIMTIVDKAEHRKRIVDVLVYSSVAIILVAVLATLLGSDMTQVASMYAAYVGMASLVVVGHFATKPEPVESSDTTEEKESL